MIALRLPTVSFGTVSAVVTSIGLIIGFGAAGISKSAIMAGLLIVGVADNLTDSLSIHIYQESERLEERAAFRATLANFATRLLISLSFVTLMLVFPSAIAVFVSMAWGMVLLTGLTWFVARSRGANVTTEVLKHLAVAAVVIAASRAIGILVSIMPASLV
jgi:VIT1/CCC1 family predicted Fe2+/Mn2+ transporter